MRKGFIYDFNRCVSCKSCSAACRLYNGWHESPRNVYTYNGSLYPGIAVINISLACNHCKIAACVKGCPSGALSRDNQTEAVVVDEKRCIGCRYCEWNCPYDAPRFNKNKRIIEKCNLCYRSGEIPACATACPTGALNYGTLDESQVSLLWFPGKKLEPAIEFNNKIEPATPVIFPADKFSVKKISQTSQNISGEWSLIIFSFLAMMSVSLFISSFLDGKEHGMMFLVLIALAAIVSLFHPGKPLRSWRALRNPFASPLSCEIWLMVLFTLAGAASFIFSTTAFTLTAIVTGLLLLLSVDNVYARPDERSVLHSGQTFLTGLLMISYITGSIPAFGFIAVVKIVLSLRVMLKSDSKPPSRPSPGLCSVEAGYANATGDGAKGLPAQRNQNGSAIEKDSGYLQTMRFLRITLLGIATAGIISGNGYGVAFSILVISSELLDRILFYCDFSPENIVRVIDKNIKNSMYGKKSG